MKPVTLPASHYASSWKTVGVLPLDHVNYMGRCYAELSDGTEKEDALLKLCQCFHPYLMKYLVMICRGHIPMWGARVNKDVEPFIRYFLSKDTSINRATLGGAVRNLHLAFKGMDTEEVYDILMSQLVSTIRKYDPHYTDKVKQVAERIDHELSKYPQFTTADLNQYLDFDCHRHLRLLGRHRFLVPVLGKDKRITAFRRSEFWPPPDTFFKSKPIGLTYYIQKWFRFSLQDWIQWRMSELEAKDGVYNWDFLRQSSERLEKLRLRSGNVDGTFIRSHTEETVSSASSASAVESTSRIDSRLTDWPLDISHMNIEWVNQTDDKLFQRLSRNDRFLLYLIFARDMEMNETAASLGCRPRQARERLGLVLASLQRSIAVGEFVSPEEIKQEAAVEGAGDRHEPQ